MGQDKIYTVRFLREAFEDITEIVSSFVMLESKQGARRIQKKINKAVGQIGNFPYSGAAVPDKKLAESGFRMIVIEKYLMFYKVIEDKSEIYVYRILNGKRNYPALLRSLYTDAE
ncbi:MAG: type II toxin-antitoxin system RelE/ParE family toxin [Oscillospiraceae bacterium]|nr:type II toxin-antitoxin system RelE/ParE family toxin [Oscillospiraceae bacterium]